MLDIQLLRSNIQVVVDALASRGMRFDPAPFQTLEAKRKDL